MAITSTLLLDLSKANTTTLKDAAAFYASKNFRVFPLEPENADIDIETRNQVETRTATGPL